MLLYIFKMCVHWYFLFVVKRPIIEKIVSGILPVNAHAEANILILNYINSFIFYSFNNRLPNNINCN